MKQFLPLIVLCGLVGCQKGSTSDSQNKKADSVATSPSTAMDSNQPDPSVQQLMNRLAPPEKNVGDHNSSAKYRMRGKVLILTISDQEEMSASYRTGLFVKENDQWKSLFKTETIIGKADSLVDLNGDNTAELVVSDYQGQSAGAVTRVYLYAMKGQSYELVDTLGTTMEGFDAYSDKVVTDIKYQGEPNKVNIRVTKIDIPGMDPTTTEQKPQSKTERLISWDGGKVTESIPTDYLFINGKDIWVRDAPTTGKVVMKLNSNDKCTILEKGKQETIKGYTGYWYKIDFNGKTGWVFGSQTSVAGI